MGKGDLKPGWTTTPGIMLQQYPIAVYSQLD
jgi:hypothetical protein